eukprot:4418956-Amphidinium_carterae.4
MVLPSATTPIAWMLSIGLLLRKTPHLDLILPRCDIDALEEFRRAYIAHSDMFGRIARQTPVLNPNHSGELFPKGPPRRGGTQTTPERPGSYCTCSCDDFVVEPHTLSLAFVNASSYKLHLDRMLELNANVVVMAESNHTPEDARGHKYISRGTEWERVNLHWSPAVRAPRDQRTKGRASSGVVLASSLKWEAECLDGTPLEKDHKQGRVIVTKVHYAESRAAWVVSIYAPVLRDAQQRVENQAM